MISPGESWTHVGFSTSSRRSSSSSSSPRAPSRRTRPAEMDASTVKDTPSRSTYRATLAISIALGLGILILVNFIGSRRYARFDWTTAGRYSLSEKTANVLKELKSPVQVTVFMTAGTPLFPDVDE